jgi:hypothetical protein
MRGEDHTLQFSAEFAQLPRAHEGERILGVPQGWSPSKQIATPACAINKTSGVI